MGKSTAAKMLRDLGIPVFDSDAASRASTAPGGVALDAIAKRFPDVMTSSGLDRQALAKKVFSNAHDLKALEAIIHPLVRSARRKFMGRISAQRRRAVVFDIPLLFETKSERECDA
ncbi:MAG: dephospho-CoA kinase, partial [Rhodospirillaceae bacterium]|nr:dephospho-CoA kinase [Rhodospirillaceae bacterium]